MQSQDDSNCDQVSMRLLEKLSFQIGLAHGTHASSVFLTFLASIEVDV